ncbi:MAG: Gfo/Idh/MocA family oxidoreductase, partial [Pseudomonadota bacterium]
MQTGKTPTKAVLIGAGMVAETYLAAFAGARETVAFGGLYARRPEKARAFLDAGAARHSLTHRIYSDLQDIASDAEIDFAIVATPPDARLDVIAPLAAAGKHILLEKPVGRNGREARAVVQTCDRAGVHLGVMFQHRARAASAQAKALISSGALGALALADISVPWWRAQSYYAQPERGTYARDGGGVLISQAIHTID